MWCQVHPTARQGMELQCLTNIICSSNGVRCGCRWSTGTARRFRRSHCSGAPWRRLVITAATSSERTSSIFTPERCDLPSVASPQAATVGAASKRCSGVAGNALAHSEVCAAEAETHADKRRRLVAGRFFRLWRPQRERRAATRRNSGNTPRLSQRQKATRASVSGVPQSSGPVAASIQRPSSLRRTARKFERVDPSRLSTAKSRRFDAVRKPPSLRPKLCAGGAFCKRHREACGRNVKH